MHAAVELGPLVHPAFEDRADRAPQLVVRILREGLSKLSLDRLLVGGDDLFPVLGGEVGVDPRVDAVLMLVENFFEVMVVDVEDHVGIHLDEAAIAVEGEAPVAREVGQARDCLVVQPQVQHRIHHPRHGSPGAGTHRNQQRVLGIPEGLAGDLLDLGKRRLHLPGQGVRVGVAVGVIVDAGFRGDRKARRHRQAKRAHLGQVRALAAQKVLHGGIAVRAAPAEGIDPAGHS